MQQLTRADGSPVRVLVVDDEVNIAELLAMALRYEGWDLRMAHTGTDAVCAAREFRPDAVVLDIMLPDVDGLEVMRRMRADGSDVPVLFLTAKDAVEDRIAERKPPWRQGRLVRRNGSRAAHERTSGLGGRRKPGRPLVILADGAAGEEGKNANWEKLAH